MKLILPIIVTLFLSTRIQAQEPLQQANATLLDQFPEQHPTAVFGDKINVRAAPAKDAPVVTQLFAGEAVTVLVSDTARLTQNGRTACWAKISFLKEGNRQEAYAWGGVLSPNVLKVDQTTFTYGMTKVETSKKGEEDYAPSKREVEIRAVRNNRIISSVKVDLIFESGYYTEAYLYGNLGLKTWSNVLKFTFFYEACGYPSYDLWCLWDGNKLILLPSLLTVSDAGVFAHVENYLFPESENGIPDTLLIEQKEVQGMIEDGTYDYTQKIRPIKWNGKTFEKPDMAEKN